MGECSTCKFAEYREEHMYPWRCKKRLYKYYCSFDAMLEANDLINGECKNYEEAENG